jgi:hypothetical protein
MPGCLGMARGDLEAVWEGLIRPPHPREECAGQRHGGAGALRRFNCASLGVSRLEDASYPGEMTVRASPVRPHETAAEASH